MKYVAGIGLILIGVLAALSIVTMPSGGDSFTGLVASSILVVLTLFAVLRAELWGARPLAVRVLASLAALSPLVSVLLVVGGASTAATIVVVIIGAVLAVSAAVLLFRSTRGGVFLGILSVLIVCGMLVGFGVPALWSGIIIGGVLAVALASATWGVLALSVVHTDAIAADARTPEADPAVSKVTDR